MELSQSTRTDVPSQQWLMGYETGLLFQNVHSGYCADSAYGGTTPGTTTLQWICNGQDGMRWAYLPHGDGTYGIINWISGLALTVAGASPTPVQQQPYTGAANQRWRFNQISVPAPQHNGVYHLFGLDNRENAEVAGGSTASGALVTHAAPTTGNSQRWRLQANGSYWQLVNVNSNHCLDLVSSSTAAGIQIRQANCNASATRQQWSLRLLADRTYMLVNRYSGRSLNMTTSASSTLDQQVLDGSHRTQFWMLKLV